MKHAKGVPDPCKYSKILDWSKEQLQGAMSKSKRLTLFAEIQKQNKKLPGPATYTVSSAKDFSLKRVLGNYK